MIDTRRPFTPEQLKAAESLGFIDMHSAVKRRGIIAHAIDNVTPDIASDRDDAIHVEAAKNGEGSVIEVTIADVAGHVPLSNPLAEVAHARAFTVYRPQMNDPMFVKALEDRMSLEHQQPRYGLTVHSERDADLNQTYLEFEKTLVIPDNTDYAMAQSRMQHDPQFMLMRDIAQGLRERIKTLSPEAYAEMKATRPKHSTDSHMEASKVVQAYMLMANEDVATFMERAKLPFLYRNFEDDAKDENGISRAYYSTRLKRHDALSRDGLRGAYCHFTSPIRRGADYYNAHMVHFVIDGVDQLEQQLREAFPALDAKKLHRALWQQAPEMFALLQEKSTAQEYLVARLANITGEPAIEPALRGIAQGFLDRTVPLSISRLDRSAREINLLNNAEQAALSAPHLQRWIASEQNRSDVKQYLATVNATDWANKSARDFSAALRNAAKCQVMTDGLRNEALRRLTVTDPDVAIGQGALTQDAFSILIVSGTLDADWRLLKKAACRAIKNNPSVVNNVLGLAEKEEYLPTDMHRRPASTPLPIFSKGLLKGKELHTIQTALLHYWTPEGVILAAPYYSVGHDERSASSHARYSFVEHYAFAQLQPVEQTAIPNLLYADLDHPDADRQVLVKEMAARLGASFNLVEYKRDGVSYARAIVKGGSLHAPIDATASSNETDNLEKLALTRLLRSPAFKNAFTFVDLSQMHSLVNPYGLLQQHLSQLHAECRFETFEKPMRGGQSKYGTIITVQGDGVEAITFEDSGPNKDRSLHGAATKALDHYGWLPERLPVIGSWVTKTDRPAIDPMEHVPKP